MNHFLFLSFVGSYKRDSIVCRLSSNASTEYSQNLAIETTCLSMKKWFLTTGVLPITGGLSTGSSGQSNSCCRPHVLRRTNIDRLHFILFQGLPYRQVSLYMKKMSEFYEWMWITCSCYFYTLYWLYWYIDACKMCFYIMCIELYSSFPWRHSRVYRGWDILQCSFRQLGHKMGSYCKYIHTHMRVHASARAHRLWWHWVVKYYCGGQNLVSFCQYLRCHYQRYIPISNFLASTSFNKVALF